MRFPLALALALALHPAAYAADSDGTQPDPVLTPGVVETQSVDVICGQSTKERRHATLAEKLAVYHAYGLVGRLDGYCGQRGGCVLDDRVPIEVGGSNSPSNLWPQVNVGPLNQERKNVCENAAHKALCSGAMSVENAQAIFLGDWAANCSAFMGEKR